MTPDAMPAEVLAGIGLGASGGLRELQAGLTHRSYRFELAGEPHVLRIDTGHAARLGLDRSLEFDIQCRAAAAGLAPAIRYADADTGVLVYRYLPGCALTADNLADHGTLVAISRLMREVHALPASGRKLDLAAAAARYTAILRPVPALHAIARRCLGIIGDGPPAARLACCHNDVVAGNVIANSSLRLIDWEYAADNDPLFDLACLIGYHDLAHAEADTLLTAYQGGVDVETRERLAQQCRVFDALQWLWLAARQVLAASPDQRDRLEALRRRLG